ncbi:hypothetical protein PO909_006722 [Leuciscus waleckii]
MPSATRRWRIFPRRTGGAGRGGRMCRMASVCFWAAENCWAKFSTASPNSPTCDMGESRNLTLSASLMSARLSQRWRYWTTKVGIARPITRAATFVPRRERSVAVRSSPMSSRSGLPSCMFMSAWAWWT